MTIKELKNLSPEELQKELARLREEVRGFRFKIHSKEVKNNHNLKQLRKDIARILTLMNVK